MACKLLLVVSLLKLSSVWSTLVDITSDPSFPRLPMADPLCTTVQQRYQDELRNLFCRNTVFFPNYCRSYCDLCQNCEDLYPGCVNMAKSILCTNFTGVSEMWSCNDSCPFVDVLIPDDIVLKEMQNIQTLIDGLCSTPQAYWNPRCLQQVFAEHLLPNTTELMMTYYVQYLCSNLLNYRKNCQNLCGMCEDCENVFPDCSGFALHLYCLSVEGSDSDLMFLCHECDTTCLVLPNNLTINDLNCFPPASKVVTSTGEVKEMKDIVVGDKLLSLTKDERLIFSDVYVFLHYNPRDVAKFYTLETEDGASITLSPEHLVYVLDASFTSPVPHFTQVKFAENVQIGDVLAVVDLEPQSEAKVHSNITKMFYVPQDNELSHTAMLKASRVVAKYVKYKQGLFAPMTLEGTIVVDNVIASCYSGYDAITSNELVMTPLRVAYHFRSAMSTWIGWLQSYMPAWLNWKVDGHRESGYDVSSGNHDDNGVHWFARMLMAFAPPVQISRN